MFGSTTGSQVIKFKGSKEKNDFAKVLVKKFQQYFKENNITPYATPAMWAKAFTALFSWVLVYALIMSDVLSNLPGGWYYAALIAAFTLLGFVNIFIAFAISHDAAHGAFSKKKWVNKILGLTFNFTGGNIYLLTKIHSTHHLFANIHGIDPQMESHGLLRNTPYEKYLGKHKYQHIYVVLIYALAYLHWVVIKDFKWMFFEKHIGNEKNIKHPLKEYFILVFFKILYFTLNLVLPLMFLSAPVWVIVTGFIMIHILPGMTFALIFQANHVFEGTNYPVPNDSGQIDNNYAIHTLETTLDFARKNKLATFLMGGINVHVVHHMFPQYCHIHNNALTEILIETCNEYGLKYNEVPTLTEAIKIHFSMLKRLSRPDAKVPAYDQKHAKVFSNPINISHA